MPDGLLPVPRQPAGLLPVEERAYGLLGADPSVDRATFLPMGRTAEGNLTFAWPGALLDMAQSAMLPGHVAQGGSWSPDDVTRMALDFGMLGTGAQASRALAGGREGIQRAMDPSTASMAGAKPRGVLDDVAHGADNAGMRVPIFSAAEVAGIIRGVDDPAAVRVLEASGFRKNNWLRPDNTLSGGGRRFADDAIQRHNFKVTKAAEKKFLKTVSEEYGPILSQAHKNQNLMFKAIPAHELDDITKARLHKSPVHRGRQSSEYYVGVVDGKPAYIRKANHWGTFSTNIKEGDADAPAGAVADQFGRVGSRSYRWDLEGGARRADGNYPNTSQTGYVLLEDLLK